MITEQSLRSALQAEAADAAPIDLAALGLAPPTRDGATFQVAEPTGTVDAHPAGRRRRPGRTVAVVVAAGGLAAAVAVGVLVATGSHPPTTVPPAASGRSTGFDVVYWNTLDPVPGLVVASRTLREERQSVVFGTRSETSLGTMTTQAARVDLYAPGAFDAHHVAGGTRVTVGAVDAVRTSIPVQLHDGVPESTTTVPVLAWQWRDGSWAVATGLTRDEQTVEAESALVAAVVVGDAPLRVPATFDSLPAGLTRTSVTVDTAFADAVTISVGFDRTGSPAAADGSSAYGLMLTVGPASTAPPAHAPTSDPTDPVVRAGVVAGGVTYAVSTVHLSGSTTAYVNAVGSRFTAQISVDDTVSPSFDPQWAQFTPAASFTDERTWPDARTALP